MFEEKAGTQELAQNRRRDEVILEWRMKRSKNQGGRTPEEIN